MAAEEKGTGPARIQVLEVEDDHALAALAGADAPKVRAPLHEREKWTKYFLSAEDIEILRSLRTDERLSPLEEYASVDVVRASIRKGI